ncbi:sulfite exporter TauE/SafE family protein [Rhodohalobacter sp. 614A]|uniref:sulfite exporter TauE/SafE family protein n=1 Tax=Rhodohalobacter sp. 614A TaxID=2908649 RepID=UPI001F46C0B4|nr:sulfite exporter TauE/SafE family protein [Rhodohalobacter sp. 614A]
MIFILLVLCGVLAGTLAGLFGIGGGILFTPILFFLFTSTGLENPTPWTIATSLFCTFTASISSSIQQRKERNFHWKEGFLVGLLGSIGVYFGKVTVTSPYYTKDVFVALFSILLFIVAILFYRRSRTDITFQVINNTFGVVKAGIAGVLGGIVASLAGVGGGIVLVPIMNLLYKLKLAKAVSISSLAIVLISLSGWLQFAFLSGTHEGLTQFTIGYVDFGSGLPLIIGAFAGGFLGVRIGHSVDQHYIQIGFSVLILIIATMMIGSIA